ncbi:MAG: GNAT family N-acetyltransferase [Dehalococcoidia bacterium]|nr:GNAT family N-acetyltransferase [Dehalococcoidia bacterium]
MRDFEPPVTESAAVAEARPAAPRALRAADHRNAVQALTRAFRDDPLMCYIWPDDTMRRKLLPIFMRGAIQLAAPYRECFTTGETPLGAALWLPPGKTKLPLPTVLRIMLPDIWRWRPGPLRRFAGILDEFDKKHRQAFHNGGAREHWYLMLLGVDPPHQGRGLGGLLMSDVLTRADSEGRAAYLETQKAKNVPFYEKHGFAVVEQFNCDAGRGPECWTMLRPARR